MDNIILSQLKESFDREEAKVKIQQKKEEEIAEINRALELTPDDDGLVTLY